MTLHAIVDGTYSLKCGCVVLLEFERLVTFCAKHGEQCREIHARALREHAQTQAQAAQ